MLEKFNSYCNNDEFCKDINDIFKINDYSYVIINSKIIKIDSTFLDEQGIEKLSYLLKNDTDFSQTLKHYNDSINNFQSNNFDSAITEGNRFFESLLMNITNQKKLNNQKDLKKKLMSLGIFPDYSQNI